MKCSPLTKCESAPRGRISILPISWFRAIAVLGGTFAAFLGYHAGIEAGIPLLVAIDKYSIAANPKIQWDGIEIGLTCLAIAFMAAGSGRCVYSPTRWKWTAVLWPLYVPALQLLHYVYDHQGRAYWWPATASGQAMYLLHILVLSYLIIGFIILVLSQDTLWTGRR